MIQAVGRGWGIRVDKMRRSIYAVDESIVLYFIHMSGHLSDAFKV